MHSYNFSHKYVLLIVLNNGEAEEVVFLAGSSVARRLTKPWPES